jgi:tRNA(Ile2)-agmatinylcytidine synthase
MITMHIGFDDTDSPRTGCTTYIAAVLVEKLCKLGVSFIDYPNLVRLNPNVPWKTRGNGALCLRIQYDEDLTEEIVETVVETVEKNSDLDYTGTDPGVVFFFHNHIPSELKTFAKRTIQGIVKMEEALKLTKKLKAEAVGFKKGRGIIGGLAAIGETLEGDHTYEVIAYRTPKNRGTPRRIQASSVAEMDEKTSPLTFNNIDPEKRRVLIAPRGPDPVLYGIRGEKPEVVKQAHEIVRSQETIERWVIFRTNHGTDAHLRQVSSIREIQSFSPVIARGVVARKPWMIPGRHIIFFIKDNTGQIDCAAYEPTGALREAAKKLIEGDQIEAHGGVRPASPKHPLTINLEKMRILGLAPEIDFRNPMCSQCGKRMESMGRQKGFRCKKCGFRSSRLEKVAVESKRSLERKLYITSPRSQRHLAKPHLRYGREKSNAPKNMIKDWHCP